MTAGTAERLVDEFAGATRDYYGDKSKKYTYRLKRSVAARSAILAHIAEITAQRDALMCSGCPPVGYPTDKTRCTPCPRRRSNAGEKP